MSENSSICQKDRIDIQLKYYFHKHSTLSTVLIPPCKDKQIYGMNVKEIVLKSSMI